MLPNSTSSLQPPHFQPSPGGPFLRVSQPQMVAEPSEQARVTANATPAEAIAWTNADSLVAMEMYRENKQCYMSYTSGCYREVMVNWEIKLFVLTLLFP